MISLRKIAIIGGDEYGFGLQSDRMVERVEVVATLQSLDCCYTSDIAPLAGARVAGVRNEPHRRYGGFARSSPRNADASRR